MEKLKTLLSVILSCGYMDVDYIISLFDDFDVEYSDIDFEERKDANDVIHNIFTCALEKVGIDMYDEKWEKRVSIYTNCLDSHLYIDDEEINSLDELREIVEKEEV